MNTEAIQDEHCVTCECAGCQERWAESQPCRSAPIGTPKRTMKSGAAELNLCLNGLMEVRAELRLQVHRAQELQRKDVEDKLRDILGHLNRPTELLRDLVAISRRSCP